MSDQRTIPRSTNKYISDRSLEWFSSGVMLVWSITLALPGDTFSIPSYVEFRRYGMSETAWACIFGIFGSGRIVALVINGRWPSGPWIRMAGALFGATIWSQICVMLTQGAEMVYHMAITSTGLYALIAMSDLFSIQRAARDARYYS